MSELKTCFKKVDYDLSALLHYIDIGDIALPDIQRPFVWSNAKVRDLFDSMYRGFPVGYFLFWENSTGVGTKQIGIGSKQHAVAHRLIVDGQQRLTSLFAVFRGRRVLDEDYKERQIEVAFRPRDGKFEVADAAIRRDSEWISNISHLWASGQSSYQMVKGFLKQLAAAKGELPESDEEKISHNLDHLFDLQKYPFTALEIAATVDEEQVADIFVRINSEGVRLNQADFILTLMSVFLEDGRKALEAFCRSAREARLPDSAPSSFNHFIQPDPDQLLRVAVAVGFQRGRLKSVYQILRGKDMDTGEFSATRRDEQFALLQSAQDGVLNLRHWHQYLSCLIGAGFRSEGMVSSQTALLYAYAFYLIGRKRFALPEHRLQRLIGRWFFAASLTGRYTSSPETVMDGDLNRLKSVKDGDGLETTLEGIMANELTNDFWTVTLPSNLDSSSARNPELFAYMAAQNSAGAPVLFSHKKISDLLDPSIRSIKKALERHHLFPRAWLERSGVNDLKQINQVANFALLEWPDNIDISDDAPTEYVPVLCARFSPQQWALMHERHALPENWYQMSYEDFLVDRRKRMAAIIRQGFESLQAAATPSPEQPEASLDLSALPSVAVAPATVSSTGGEDSDQDDDLDTDSTAELTPLRQFRLEYWAAFLDELRRQNLMSVERKPRATASIGFPVGHSKFRLWTEIFAKDKDVGLGMTFKPPHALKHLETFRQRSAELEEELGFSLEWDPRPDAKFSYVAVYFGCDPDDRTKWTEQHEWLGKRLARMQQVFSRHIEALNL